MTNLNNCVINMYMADRKPFANYFTLRECPHHLEIRKGKWEFISNRHLMINFSNLTIQVQKELPCTLQKLMPSNKIYKSQNGVNKKLAMWMFPKSLPRNQKNFFSQHKTSNSWGLHFHLYFWLLVTRKVTFSQLDIFPFTKGRPLGL